MKIIELIPEDKRSFLPPHFYIMQGTEISSKSLWVFMNNSINGFENVQEFYKPISLI